MNARFPATRCAAPVDPGAKWVSFVTPRSGGSSGKTNNAPFDIAVSRGLQVFADI
jgi:hypothetical protein